MKKWFEETAAELENDAALRTYGVLLSLVHALTGSAWFHYKHVAELASGDDAVCWPLLPACGVLRPLLTPDIVRAAVAFYMATAIASAALIHVRRSRAGLGLFLVATLAGAAIYSLDYRLRLNETYMFGWAVLVFLFARRKLAALQALVALFYLWAGTLKLNAEWVTGAALYAKPLLVPRALVPASCVYVLVLELGLVWGLFARSAKVRGGVLAQFLLFHFVSFGVVGYFYPLEMFAVTAVFPLAWIRWPKRPLTFASLRRDPADRRSVVALAAAFSAFQVMPHLFPGDTAVTGEGRLFALHMFDARTQCKGGATVTLASGERARVPLIAAKEATRMHCDPIVLMARAKSLCRQMEGRPSVTEVDVTVEAKRTTDTVMRPLIHATDVCRRDTRYSLWRHNAWIGGEDERSTSSRDVRPQLPAERAAACVDPSIDGCPALSGPLPASRDVVAWPP